MSFVCAEGVASSKLGLIVHEMVGRSEIRIAPRAAIASCLLNGRTLNTLQESLLVLAYAHVFLLLSAANFRGVVAGVLFSGFLSFLMGASSVARSLGLSLGCSLVLAVADLLVTACLAQTAPAAYLVAVGAISLAVLYLLQLDQSKRQGVCLYLIKDLGILTLGGLKLAGWGRFNRTVVVGTIVLLVGAIGYHRVLDRRSLSAPKSATTSHRPKKTATASQPAAQSKTKAKAKTKAKTATRVPAPKAPLRRAAALKATGRLVTAAPSAAEPAPAPPASEPRRSARAAVRKARTSHPD